MATRYKALIAGATGAASKRLVELLAGDPQWEVIGLCRTPPAGNPGPRLSYVSVDLESPRAVREVLSRITGITHAFYCCRARHDESGVESVEANLAMLQAMLEPLAETDALQHVHLVEGGKWYGVHLGPFPTPAYEDALRHMPPNFYYDQEDYLRERQKGRRWTWSASRPNFLSDFDPERARNIVSLLGTWAAMCRECGTPLDFPGKPGAFTALTELTDASHYARALRYISTTPACANRAFNVTNGEPFRWSRFWPKLAQLYGLEVGIVRPLKLSQWMADKEPLWSRMVARHGLRDQPMGKVALWNFADFAFNQDYDVFYSMHRLRESGFGESVDSMARLIEQISRYREARIIP